MYLGAAAGVIISFLAVVAVRLEYPPEHTHYHANFALFINGEREEFKSFAFYEEVQSCVDPGNNPRHRVHMHDRVNHVVHVHEPAVTWGHFFANIGFGLTNNSVKTDGGVFVDGINGKKLSFVLNGQPVQVIANEVINSEDVLLVDYGSGENLQDKYNQITQDANEYNRRNDPSSCSGPAEVGPWESLKRAIKFWQ